MSAGTERFGTFVLDGPRFSAPGVPVEALAELVAYREIVVDVARQLFLSDRPERERSIRNLDKKLDLRLTAVNEGSADLMLTRAVADDELVDDEGRPLADLLEDSRDLVTEAIRSVVDHFELPARFPRKSLPRFRAFGRSLGKTDSVRVGNLSGDTVVYNESARSKFLDLIADNSRAARQEISGRIVELDPERFVFHLRTAEDYRVPGFYGSSDLTIPNSWLVNDEGDAPLVSVVGSALVSDDGVIQRFLSVDEVTPAGLDSLLARVDALSQLESGWMGPGSDPILPTAIEFVRGVLQKLQSIPAGLSPAPLPDGGLRLEWTREGIDYVVEAEADGGLYLCRLGLDAEDDEDRQLASYDGNALLGFFSGELA
jgi:hypothetical protein